MNLSKIVKVIDFDRGRFSYTGFGTKTTTSIYFIGGNKLRVVNILWPCHKDGRPLPHIETINTVGAGLESTNLPLEDAPKNLW
jgi:hypothetical protein